MDLSKFPPIPKSRQEILADQHLVALRLKYGDDSATRLGKVATAIVQYLVTRTYSPEEGLDVLQNVVDSLKLAITLDKEEQQRDPQTN